MKKKSLIYSDLSNKQLQHLKELYINKKINTMSNQELKDFVNEIITHQIMDTIDKEEENEAWKEMSDFFGEKFEIVVLEIINKYKDELNQENMTIDPQKLRHELLERNNLETEKKDMWDD